MLEARVGDERRPRARPLEQRIRRDGRAVGEPLEARRADSARSGDTDSSCRAAVGTFAVVTRPPSRTTASVNVPPTSTPRTAIQED